jgi:transketolase
LGKGKEPVVHRSEPPFELGKAILLRDGSDATLISTGGILETVVKAGDQLARSRGSIRILSMPTVCPLDEGAVLAAASQTRLIVTVEEHGHGGLASAVAEVLAASRARPAFVPLRLRREAMHVAGSQEFLRARQGLSVEGIVAAVREAA